MARPAVLIRCLRISGPRKSRVSMQMRPVLFFVLLNLAAASLGTMFVLLPVWREAGVTEAREKHRPIQYPSKIDRAVCENPEHCR